MLTRDVTKIFPRAGESIEKYRAWFRTVQTKFTTVMIERDCIRLVQDGLLWLLKKYFLRIKSTGLYHLSFEEAKYERARIARASSKAQINNGMHYR